MNKNREQDLEKIIADGIAKGIQEAKKQEQKEKGNGVLNTFVAIAIFITSILGGGVIIVALKHYFNIPEENTTFITIFLCNFLLTYLWGKKDIKKAWNDKKYGSVIFTILIMIGIATFTGFLIA